MKIIFAVALATIALPVYAQGQTTTPPSTNGIPDTMLSTSSAPSTGPRAQEGNLPSNNAAATTSGAVPAPAPLDHYPICQRGQFDKCMEPGNGAGKAYATRHRHHH
ncbi:hypothetical protein QH494_12640 [Sphingomonas sp. AR_OL41]|uniref:hypothetical protein n=1 Tax=Sphingomonas sp. AR_OL41 TaxID=3042729 RepID=UPI002480194D|nr:hypothetical protein [Sphingomonas sp. AR_OL41]MDH7973027.1 hypothetical protein [Sphingomonas sp. AR_OL41]